METNGQINSLSQVCRTCLQEIHNNLACAYLNTTVPNGDLTTIRDKLTSFVPEINLTITPNAVLCENCVAAIEFTYKFKTKCLLTEKYISAYIHETVHSVDLSQIIKNHNKYVIDLDKPTLSACPEEQEEKDVKISEIKVFEEFTANAELTVISDSADEIEDVVVQHNIEPFEVVDLNSVTQPATPPDNSDDEEIDDENIPDDIIPVLVPEQPTEISSNKEYKCNGCSYATNKKRHLRKHMKVHSEQDIKHRCTICNYGTKHKTSMMVHMTTHTTKKPYKCGQCNFQSTHVGYLKRHLNKHASFRNTRRCTECSVDFKYESCLKVHMISHTLEKISKCLKEEWYQCTECSYKCNRKGQLKNHIKTHKKRKRRCCHT